MEDERKLDVLEGDSNNANLPRFDIKPFVGNGLIYKTKPLEEEEDNG